MKEIPFEKALDKLEKIVDDLETGELSLDTALKKYEEGVKLARMCQAKLDKAKEKIEILTKKDKDSFSVESFQEETGEE